jgi:hypothetical protein
MRPLQGEILLKAWERCSQQPGPARALTLLQASLPEWKTEDLAELPLAERNRLLLELRAITFGHKVEGFAVCEHCGAQLEFVVDAREIAAQISPAEPQTWIERDRELCMRPANTSDVLACMAAKDESDAHWILLSRTTGWNDESNAESLEDLMRRFDAINSSSEIQLALRCAGCRETCKLDLDIARFLDRETEIAARRLFTDIHRLATAYGWSEQSIAEMSSRRRANYLAMLDG